MHILVNRMSDTGGNKQRRTETNSYRHQLHIKHCDSMKLLFSFVFREMYKMIKKQIENRKIIHS